MLEIGKSGDPDENSATAKLEALAEAAAKEKGISKAAAMLEVADTEEGRKLRQESQTERETAGEVA